MEIIKVFICPPLNKSIYIHRSDEISEYGKYESIYIPTFNKTIYIYRSVEAQTRKYGRRMGGYSSSY